MEKEIIDKKDKTIKFMDALKIKATKLTEAEKRKYASNLSITIDLSLFDGIKKEILQNANMNFESQKVTLKIYKSQVITQFCDFMNFDVETLDNLTIKNNLFGLVNKAIAQLIKENISLLQ